MNHDFLRLMGDATQLTRSGDLGAATQAIQQALAGSAAWPTAANAAPNSRPGPSQSSAPARDGIVLDGLTRIVPDDEAPAATVAPSATVAEPAGRAPQAAPQSAPAAAAEQWIKGNFSHQGRSVAYQLFVPAVDAGADLGDGRPLIVMLHGCTQSAADFAAGTQMHAVAKAQGALVLYPEQNSQYNPQRCWNWFKPQHQQRNRGEPALLAELTRSVVANYPIDVSRVYVAGLSAGGAMADVLGHCYPDVFAAVGVHSGLPAGAANDVVSAMAAMRAGPAAPRSPSAGPVPPTIVFHGDADTTVHARNGAAVVDAARIARASPALAATAPVTQHGATCVAYAEPGKPSQVEHWQLHGAGHAWSGGSAHGSYTNPGGVDASAQMLRFFMQHRRAG